MSSATVVDASPPRRGNKKKLLIIVAAVLLLLAVAGGVGVVLLKKKAASQAEATGDDAQPAQVAKAESRAVPVFVPLDTFTVNLADRDAERYAQIGMTLEIEDAKLGDQIKLFMPAIRNNILLAIADKSATQLMDRDGKRQLALEIRRETSRALGYDVPTAPGSAVETAAEPAKSGKKPKDPNAALPIRAVHFNNFIIQ
jgi:flagellar FliL protein